MRFQKHLDLLESWIQLANIAAGIVMVIPPILNFWRSDKHARGRRLGSVTPPGGAAVLKISILYVAVGILLWRPLPLQLSNRTRLVCTLAGSLLYFPGVGLYLWGYRALGRMFSISSTLGAQLYADHELVVTGPYRFVRHPMYLGVLLAGLGALLIHRTWNMLLLALSLLVVIFRARHEDAVLALEFGEAWQVYCKQVPGWFPVLKTRQTHNQ